MKPDRYAPDPNYRKPPKWGRLYQKYFPTHTDACSRHAGMIADWLRDPRAGVRKALIDSGYAEPDHWASSIELTVEQLWKTRAELRALRLKYEPDKLHADEAATLSKAVAKMRKAADAALPASESTGEVGGEAEQTTEHNTEAKQAGRGMWG